MQNENPHDGFSEPKMLADRYLSAAKVLACIAVAVCLARAAWISDDALITLRTALNLTHGWGAGYNSVESVQAYSHPLWFLVWSILGWVTGEWILTVLFLGVILSTCTALVMIWQSRNMASVIWVAGALVLSNAFIEYGTSGLENPLSMLSVVLLVLLTVRGSQGRRTLGFGIILGATWSAVVLTRLDLVLMVLPPLVVALWAVRRSLRQVLAPVVTSAVFLSAWFVWSWSTYSAILPNTFEAKTNVDIERSELLLQGARYLLVSFGRDPATGIALTIAVTFALLVGGAIHRFWVIGIVLYLGYVVWVGGDFMAGRFLAVPLVAAVTVAILASYRASVVSSKPGACQTALAAGVVSGTSILLVTLGLAPTSLSPASEPKWSMEDTAGIADERGWYMQFGRGFTQWLMGPDLDMPEFEFRPVNESNPMATIAELRSAAALWPENVGAKERQLTGVGRTCWLGAAGITTGPGVHWIDVCGLSDRFLATQPFRSEGKSWRIGHFERRVPDGYDNAVLTGDSSLVRGARLREILRDLWRDIRD